MDETQEEKILEVMGIGPGDLRNKVELGKWLLYSMRELSNLFNKEAYPVLTELMTRMELRGQARAAGPGQAERGGPFPGQGPVLQGTGGPGGVAPGGPAPDLPPCLG